MVLAPARRLSEQTTELREDDVVLIEPVLYSLSTLCMLHLRYSDQESNMLCGCEGEARYS